MTSEETINLPQSKTGPGYRYDLATGLFIEEVFIQESPLEPGIWHTPPDVTIHKPPSIEYVFNGSKWITTGPLKKAALSFMKQQKRIELNDKRDQLIASGFEAMGHRFDSDAMSISKINGAVTMAVISQLTNDPFEIIWTTEANDQLTLDANGMIALGLACASWVDHCHHQCVALKEEMKELTSIVAIKNFKWNEANN